MDTTTLHALFLDSKGVTTDTRSISEGQLYFALKGESFNGNAFALQALEKGASYAIVDEPVEAKDSRLIYVDEVLETLQVLAAYHRAQLDIPVIGITGSNGKTTTKELMRDVLAKRFKVLATKGNFNNHIGVPLTLLELNSTHEIAIIEMGANHVGEIELLSAIAQPSHGLITNIGRAHIGEFGGQANIIKGKTELYKHLEMTEGTVFVNGASTLLMGHSEGLDRVIYGKHADSQCLCDEIAADPYLRFSWEGHEINSQLIGDYNLTNMSAAIGVGSYFEVSPEDICSAIAAYNPDNNRSQLIRRGDKRIIMDAYNANPDSMEAALHNLGALQANHKLAILGDMLELGEESLASHQAIIALASKLELEVILVGAEFMGAAADGPLPAVPNTEAAREHVRTMTRDKSLILIKGSRGIKLETLLEEF